MKMKSLAMLSLTGFAVISSLLATTPAIADDNDFASNDQAMQMADSGMQADPAMPADGGMMQADNGMGAPQNPSNDTTTSMNNAAPADMGNIGASNDAGGPDTATGDDDY